jgi:hypothetical protein
MNPIAAAVPMDGRVIRTNNWPQQVPPGQAAPPSFHIIRTNILNYQADAIVVVTDNGMEDDRQALPLVPAHPDPNAASRRWHRMAGPLLALHTSAAHPLGISIHGSVCTLGKYKPLALLL